MPKNPKTSEEKALSEELTLRQKNLMRYARITIEELERISTVGGESIPIDKPVMLRMPFRNHIPEERWDTVLDWSHSNMSDLFDIGYDTAMLFVQEHWKKLDFKSKPKMRPLRRQQG